jgi:hypothetical protein
MRLPLAFLVAALLGGCSGGEQYLPLRAGAKWTYGVRSGFLDKVVDVQVTGRAPVESANGWSLSSPMGASRLAWVDGSLLADTLAGTRYSPPLPLLKADRPSAHWKWAGLISSADEEKMGRATVQSKPTTYRMGAKTYEVVRVEHRFSAEAGADVVLVSYYAEDLGLLRQEQRRLGVLERALDYVSGP